MSDELSSYYFKKVIIPIKGNQITIQLVNLQSLYNSISENGAEVGFIVEIEGKQIKTDMGVRL